MMAIDVNVAFEHTRSPICTLCIEFEFSRGEGWIRHASMNMHILRLIKSPTAILQEASYRKFEAENVNN
jgi:hypothetical protein